MVPDVTSGGCGQVLPLMRARCCICFFHAVNCHLKDRLHGPTGCLASCTWAMAGQESKGNVSSGREFPDFANDLETGLQRFPIEQAWSQSVLALCDTAVARGKTLMVRLSFLLTMQKPRKTSTLSHS